MRPTSLATRGIRLSDPQGLHPEITWWTTNPPLNVLPRWEFVVKTGTDESVADSTLVVDSVYPIQRIGMNLVNDSRIGSGEMLPVTLTAQDAEGSILGTYELQMQPGSAIVALEEDQGAPISRVVIDYADGNPEMLLGLWLQYVERPVFTSYFAHLADGRLPDGENITSSIVVTNLSNSTATGEIRFFDDLGDPLALEVGPGDDRDHVGVSIPGRESMSWTTAGITPGLRSGSARVTTNVPVSATIRFTSKDTSGVALAEAGIASSRPEAYVIAPATQQVTQGVVGGTSSPADEFSTAVAVANTSEEPVRIRLVCSTTSREVFRDLPARGHLAEFLAELFPEKEDTDFNEALQIWASQPIAVTVLHTRNGRAYASLPAVGRQR